MSGANNARGLESRRLVDRRRSLFQVMAKALAELGCLGYRDDAFRIDCLTVPRRRCKGDFKVPGVSPHLGKIRTLRRGCPIRIADVRAGSRLRRRCRAPNVLWHVRRSRRSIPRPDQGPWGYVRASALGRTAHSTKQECGLNRHHRWRAPWAACPPRAAPPLEPPAL